MANLANTAPTGGLTPHIAIRDRRAAEAIDFYAKAFGAEEVARVPADDGVRLMHAHLHINGASLMMHDEFPEYVSEPSGKPEGVTLHLHVDDTDGWYDRAIAAGAVSVMAPENMFWGDRYAQVRDPFGHLWSIGHPLKGEDA
jgi:PhnB protein